MKCIKCNKESTHTINLEYLKIDKVYSCDDCFKEVKKDFNMAIIHHDSGDMLFVNKIYKKYKIGESTNEKINWNDEIEGLENYFSQKKIPNKRIKLNLYTTITNVDLFLENHLSMVKANNGKKTFLPYLERLKEFKNKIENEEYNS